MQVQGENQLYDDINITPMLDLAYVLLVTFIIMTTAAVQGIRVESPRTSMAMNLSKPQTKAITVTADGSVYIDAYPVNLEELEAQLALLKSNNPSQPVVLKGDSAAQYQKVMEVLEVLKKVDIVDVGLVTKRQQ